METTKNSIRLKTTMKCSGCVATVTPFLNQAVGEGNWAVDTQDPDKVLTVTTDNVPGMDVPGMDVPASLGGMDVPVETVVRAIQQAGFRAELLA